MKSFVNYLIDNTGRCIVCMRQSFQLAVMSWVATVGLMFVGGELLGHLGLISSLGLSLLWLTHLVAFAARNSIATSVGTNTLTPPIDFFLRNLAFAAGETAVLYRRGARDRFGLPMFGRSFVVELKNPDGSRTAYSKNIGDISALVQELKSRGYIGELVDPEYWMSTDSCERSSARECANNTCDVATQSCKGTGGMGACRCS